MIYIHAHYPTTSIIYCPGCVTIGAVCILEIISRSVASLVVMTSVLRSRNVHISEMSPYSFWMTRASWFSTILSTKLVCTTAFVEVGDEVAKPSSGMCCRGV